MPHVTGLSFDSGPFSLRHTELGLIEPIGQLLDLVPRLAHDITIVLEGRILW